LRINFLPVFILLSIFAFTNQLFGHGMSEEEKQIIIDGGNLQYIYIGMTHMLSGYDHLLFIFGVLFFISGFKQIVKFITVFTIGHSITLILATFNEVQINYYLIDAIIALSVCYIAFVNLNGFEKLFNSKPINMLNMVFIFGLIHGLGLSTRLQQLPLNEEQLFLNILSFNIGVEVGQITALAFMLVILNLLQKSSYFSTLKQVSNIFLIVAGLALCYFQFDEYNKNKTSKIETLKKYKDIVEITLPAKSEKEYKTWMLKDKTLSYSWSSGDVDLYFDFHGEPANDTSGYFKSYKEATASKDSGSVKTSFIGTHGWYWKNSSSKDAKIILKLDGEYKVPKYK